jgi:hypothetical protein
MDQLYFFYGRFFYGQFLYGSIFLRSKFIQSDFILSKFIQFKIYAVQNLYGQFLYSTNFIQAPRHPLLSSMHFSETIFLLGENGRRTAAILHLQHRKRASKTVPL